jgi:hypothetical protein
MIISVINRSKTLKDTEVQETIRAVNRQIKEDFEPYWGFGGTLRLEGPTGKRLRFNSSADMRGDAVMYIVDGVNKLEADGWHDKNARDIPYGMVFLGMCARVDEKWSLTFSHEVLELLGDPMQNMMVEGNDPKDRRRRVYHQFEMCDAVQTEVYTIDGIEVSNFVLPSYFSLGEQEGRRNDFLGTVTPNGTLKSFGTNPGGYVNMMDPKKGKWGIYMHPDDEVAKKRHKAKAAAKLGRGFKRAHPG